MAEALECYRRAAEADPMDAEAHIAAGAVHESQGRVAEALECYRRAAEALDKRQGGAAESMQGRSAESDLAGAGDTAGQALSRLHKRQGRLRDAGDVTRHIRNTRRGRGDGRKG